MVKGAVKRPKLYFCDTGLACYLARIYDPETLRAGYLGGPMAETFIVNEIMKSYSNNAEDAGFYYYRDKNGNEIDLVMVREGKMTLIECKAGMTYDSADVKAFSRLEHSNYGVGPSCLICMTEKAYPLKDGVYALPVTSI
jgi:predicted AAA+ superfamily ATPase